MTGSIVNKYQLSQSLITLWDVQPVRLGDKSGPDSPQTGQIWYFLTSEKVLKSDLKKYRICHFLGQSDPLWSKSNIPDTRERISKPFHVMFFLNTVQLQVTLISIQRVQLAQVTKITLENTTLTHSFLPYYNWSRCRDPSTQFKMKTGSKIHLKYETETKSIVALAWHICFCQKCKYIFS